MDIAKEIFERKRPDYRAMGEFGFVMDGDGLLYREVFMDELAAEIRVSQDGRITARAVDTDTNEEYAAVNVEAQVGAYVGAARERYTEVLRKVAKQCCVDVEFISDQANRIAKQIYKEYRRKPEFIFAKDRGTGVFRHGHNGKWFGIIMPVARGKLEKPGSGIATGTAIGGSSETALGSGEADEGSKDIAIIDPNEVIEVMNVKIDPAILDELLRIDGVYRCFHMNKKQWVTLALDETLPDEYVMSLIDYSYELTRRGAAGRRIGKHAPDGGQQERRYWIIPSNPKFFDVEGGFRDSGCDTLAWHQRIQAVPGDVVYIYQAEPIGSIKFRCEVLKAGQPRHDRSGMAPKSTEIMYLRRTDTYEKGVYSRAWMNEHGIAKTIRGQRSAPDQLVAAIEK